MSAFLDETFTPYYCDFYDYVPWERGGEVYTLGLMGTRWLLPANMDSELNYNFPIENNFEECLWLPGG